MKRYNLAGLVHKEGFGMQRMAWMIELKPDKVALYKELHNAVWPEVLDKIHECGIRNYSIFLREPENILFGIYDYVGINHDTDMEKMAADPQTREWWKLTEPCQAPLKSREKDEWWVPLEQVFHTA